MSKTDLETFARGATKGNPVEFSQILTKVIVETGLNAELDSYLGYT